MKSLRHVVSFIGLFSAFLLAHSAAAQTPQLINYQGRLLNGTNLMNGNVGLSLRLFDVSSGGSSIYEDSNSVTVVDGLYSTFIGDDTTFGNLQLALGNSNVWVEVAVNGVALAPRERMASVPYALNVNAGGVAGTIADANLSANIARLNGTNQTFSGGVNFSSASNSFTGTFSGNGAGVTNVNLGSVTAISAQPNVIAWGAGTNNLGFDDSFGQSIVPATATEVVAISGGADHSLALRADGTVIAWGNNVSGQTTVPSPATGVVAVAGGGFHSLALHGNGTVSAWGRNFEGQTTVPATATGVVAIAGGGAHSLALCGDGTVIAWGYDIFGQTNVPATATGVVAIAGGGYHSLALRGDGTVIAWGDNTYGQTNVPATATGVVAIAGGGYHSLALRGDGTVIAWGENVSGQTNVPATATGVVAVAAGDVHSLVLRSDGTVIAWGDNVFGQTIVPATATGVVTVASGGFHILALRSARAPAPLARLDVANNTFAGTVTAAAFVGNGAGLTGITNFVNKAGDTMTGALNLPAGGLTVGANQLVVTPSGNVGIGMASPPHMLDVNATSGIPTIAVGDLNGTNALFYMRANVGSSAAGTVDLLSRNAHDFTFISFPGGVGTEFMRIKGASGSVGIGTSQPRAGAALHVNGEAVIGPATNAPRFGMQVVNVLANGVVFVHPADPNLVMKWDYIFLAGHQLSVSNSSPSYVFNVQMQLIDVDNTFRGRAREIGPPESASSTSISIVTSSSTACGWSVTAIRQNLAGPGFQFNGTSYDGRLNGLITYWY